MALPQPKITFLLRRVQSQGRLWSPEIHQTNPCAAEPPPYHPKKTPDNPFSSQTWLKCTVTLLRAEQKSGCPPYLSPESRGLLDMSALGPGLSDTCPTLKSQLLQPQASHILHLCLLRLSHTTWFSGASSSLIRTLHVLLDACHGQPQKVAQLSGQIRTWHWAIL